MNRETPEEDQRIQRPKRCEKNYNDQDNSPKTLSDKNCQASSQKFRQLISSDQYGNLKRINKKICRQKMSIMFNQICISEEMLPLYIYIYI